MLQLLLAPRYTVVIVVSVTSARVCCDDKRLLVGQLISWLVCVSLFLYARFEFVISRNLQVNFPKMWHRCSASEPTFHYKLLEGNAQCRDNGIWVRTAVRAIFLFHISDDKI